MKKKLTALLIVLFVLVFSAAPVFAEGSEPLLVDSAELLTEAEADNLLSKLSVVSKSQQMDIVVVTVRSLEGKTPAAFADDFYDYNGYVEDGILLLVAMNSRDCYISTSGYGITAFTDAGIDYILDKIVPMLSDGEYAEAFRCFTELCDEFISEARSGEAYDVGHLPKGQFKILRNLLISLGIGLLVAFIVTGVMRGSLKSVKSQPTADNYIKNGSVNITRSRDRFLYRHISRRAIPKDNNSGGSSTHRSSSGSFHGGGGRKF